MENKHYCNNFITVNESIDNNTTEHLFVGNNNDDCVNFFRNNEGDDDIQSVDLTLKSMGDNTLFGKLLDYRFVDDFIVPDPEPLESVILHRPIDCITLPTLTEFTVDNDVNVDSNISDYCSDIIPVDENIKQYLMKCGNYVIRNCTSKTFDFWHNFYTREKLELMNEKWKSQVIISFSIYRKINMNEFIDWHLWVKYFLVARLFISIIHLSMVKTEQQRQNFLINYTTTNSPNQMSSIYLC